MNNPDKIVANVATILKSEAEAAHKAASYWRGQARQFDAHTSAASARRYVAMQHEKRRDTLRKILALLLSRNPT